MIEYSIVIPAYNESDKISASLTQIVGFMRSFSQAFEVIVVDDGSTDKTAEVIKSYIEYNPEVKLLNGAHKGKGPAIWLGVENAVGNYIYLADADLSAPISEIKKLSLWIKEHDYDVVIASREGVGAKRLGEPVYRHVMGRVFNLFVQVVALPGIKDTQCGFKLFKAPVAKKVFEKLKIYGQEAKETQKPYLGAFDVEVLYLAKKLGYKVKEVPVEWTYVKTTRLSPMLDSFKMAKDVLIVRLNDLRGVYK